MSIYIYQTKFTGHRIEHLRLFRLILKKRAKFGNSLLSSYKSKYLLIPSISDNTIIFLFFSILRSFFFKKKTIAIHLRGTYLFKKGFYNKLRFFIFKILKNLKNLKIVYIPSSKYFPQFNKLSKFSLDDPMLWDKHFFFKKKYKFKKEKKIIIQYIGAFNKSKGGYDFINVAKQFLDNKRYEFRINGILQDNFLKNEVLKYRNIKFKNKIFNNKEIPKLYLKSDLIWGFYDKTFDQSSGIVSRAVQFNIPVIVRFKSVISKYEPRFKNILICKNILDITKAINRYKRTKSKSINIENIKKDNLNKFLKLFDNDKKNYFK